MSTKPKFKFHLANWRAPNYRYVEVNGQPIHYILNEDELYAEFGYSEAIKQSGLTPEEFIWAEYIRDGKSRPSCLQMHLIEYLNKHSELFRRSYGVQYQQWRAEHLMNCTGASEFCVVCTLSKPTRLITE